MNLFDAEEFEVIAADPELSVYRKLTKDHVIGLLDACANYLARRGGINPDKLPLQSLAAVTDVAAAHDPLLASCYQLAVKGEPDPSHRREVCVFSDEERAKLRLHKYVRYCERLTHRQLLDLLRAVRAYSALGAIQPLMSSDRTTNRFLHAHNWVIRFGQEPFTDAEFLNDLRQTVLSRVS